MPHIRFLSSSPDLSLGDFTRIGDWVTGSSHQDDVTKLKQYLSECLLDTKSAHYEIKLLKK